MSTPSRARLVELTKLSKQIFHESFNPEQTRRGTRVLRSALRGPQVANYYYPNYFPTFKQMRLTHPDLYLVDMKEQYRLDINNEYVIFPSPLKIYIYIFFSPVNTNRNIFFSTADEEEVRVLPRRAKDPRTRRERRRNKQVWANGVDIIATCFIFFAVSVSREPALSFYFVCSYSLLYILSHIIFDISSQSSFVIFKTFTSMTRQGWTIF